MRNDTIRGVLSKLFWTLSDDELRRYAVVIVDRGVPTGIRVIRLSRSITLLKDRLIMGDTVIPLHRVIEVRRDDGVAVWRRGSALARR